MDAKEYKIACNYDNLAKAIVYQAIKDYRSTYLKVLKKKKHPSSLSRLRSFFTSEWYQCLFNYDGRDLMKYIEKNCDSKKSLNHFIFH
jgi:hypothetical protein